MADESNPLAADLAEHADRLVEGGASSLAAMWGAELKDVPAGVRKEVIKARLADPKYSGFVKPAEAGKGAQGADPAAPAGDKPVTLSDALLENARQQRAANQNPYSPGTAGRGGFRF